MTDYFALVRDVVKRDAEIRYGITVHDPYDCDRGKECRLCRDFFVDEKIDRATDERKEKGGEC